MSQRPGAVLPLGAASASRTVSAMRRAMATTRLRRVFCSTKYSMKPLTLTVPVR